MLEDTEGERPERPAPAAPAARGFQPSDCGSPSSQRKFSLGGLHALRVLQVLNLGSRGPQQQPFVQAARAVTLQIEADVAVTGGLELADNRGADLRLER